MGQGAILRAARRRSSRQRLLACAAYAAALDLVTRQGLAQLVGRHRFRRDGQRRSTARTMAMHLAREAFQAPLADISRAAKCDRTAARNSNLNVWKMRDADPELDTALWQATQQLKEGVTHG